MVLAMSFETGHHAHNKKPRLAAWFGGRNFKASQPMLRPLFWFKGTSKNPPQPPQSSQSF